MTAYVWTKDWGVHLQPFGDGTRAIQYLGRYVCKTAIGDTRLLASDQATVSFRWKDRSDHDRPKIETITGEEFVARYLRHVLPKGMRAIRSYGCCHPAAKATRERIALHTGRPLLIGPVIAEEAKASGVPTCPCCQRAMPSIRRFKAGWHYDNRGPPQAIK